MKKMSPIMEMFYGKRGQSDQIPCSQEYFILLDKFIEAEETFKAKLSHSPELKELYEKSHGAYTDLYNEIIDNNYLEGFRFGVLIGLDVSNYRSENNTLTHLIELLQK